MNSYSPQILVRISSRFIESLYGFFILIYLNKILSNYELDYFQISFFIIGLFFLFFDYGRLQHIIKKDNDEIKKQYLSSRLYFLFFLVILLSIFQLNFFIIILLSLFDIGAKNNLYDYREIKNSLIYLILNLVKVLIVICLYFLSLDIWPLIVFLLLSIYISHFDKTSFYKFKQNFKSYVSSNHDYANFLTQVIVILKSFIIYLALSRIFEFNSSESRAILFLSNACFTISMIINSSIINIAPNLKAANFFLFSIILSFIVGVCLTLIYELVPELNLDFSNIIIYLISQIALLLNLLVYFFVTKIILNKKSVILLKLYIFSLFFLISCIYIIYLYSIAAIYIILFFELSLITLFLFNRAILK